MGNLQKQKFMIKTVQTGCIDSLLCCSVSSGLEKNELLLQLLVKINEKQLIESAP